MSHFQTVDKSREQIRANTARELASYYSEMSTPAPEEKFSLARMLNAMAESNFREGGSYEANVVQAATLSQGSVFDPQRAIVPWGALMSRDLTVGTAAAGGRLVGAKMSSAVDALRPFSAAARLGVTFVENQMQDLGLPTVSQAVTGQWLANEAQQIVQSDAVIGLSNSKPKTAGAVMKASFNFMRNSAQADSFIRTQLLGAMANMLDGAVFSGTGADGQPAGTMYAAGISEATGSFAYQNALAMESAVASAGGDPAGVQFVASPNMRSLLKQFWYAQGAQTLWYRDAVVDVPATVSPFVTGDTLLLGNWPLCQVILWGSGVQIEVDPYTSFKTGAVQVRVLMYADVQFLQPAAFFRWTNLDLTF